MNATQRAIVLPLLVAACATMPEAPDPTLGHQQVWDAELAFAATMARRDHAAFQSFLSEDAVFFGGPSPLRGKAAVAEGWARYFEGPDAPFRWEPDAVEVLGSGDLALSTGPVRSPQGEVIGRFNSIWRLEGETWRVVFDKGED